MRDPGAPQSPWRPRAVGWADPDGAVAHHVPEMGCQAVSITRHLQHKTSYGDPGGDCKGAERAQAPDLDDPSLADEEEAASTGRLACKLRTDW
jgi:hypothetical protein